MYRYADMLGLGVGGQSREMEAVGFMFRVCCSVLSTVEDTCEPQLV